MPGSNLNYSSAIESVAVSSGRQGNEAKGFKRAALPILKRQDAINADQDTMEQVEPMDQQEQPKMCQWPVPPAERTFDLSSPRLGMRRRLYYCL